VDEGKQSQQAAAGLVLTAAGSSSRMGDGVKKEYRLLHGLPVLLHSLLPFFLLPSLSRTVITLPPGDEAYVDGLLESLPERYHSRRGSISLVAGAEARSASVFRGLAAFPEEPEYVLIHDAARPWVSEELIRRVLEETIRSGACIPAVPATDAMKRIDDEGIIRGHLPRSRTVAAQTPQGFRYRPVLEAHRRAAEGGETYLDDSEIYGRYAGEVRIVAGDPANTKITYPRDLQREEGRQ
jgi:2-C-methyl-D-erythritol 4-phosphate cytidylyltransferase